MHLEPKYHLNSLVVDGCVVGGFGVAGRRKAWEDGRDHKTHIIISATVFLAPPKTTKRCRHTADVAHNDFFA